MLGTPWPLCSCRPCRGCAVLCMRSALPIGVAGTVCWTGQGMQPQATAGRVCTLASLQVVSKLHQILKPFLLRRVKTDVETSLPGKMEVRRRHALRAVFGGDTADVNRAACRTSCCLPQQRYAARCHASQALPCRLPAPLQVILYAGMSDKQKELNQQLRDRTLNVRHRDTLGRTQLALPGWVPQRCCRRTAVPLAASACSAAGDEQDDH